MKYKSFKGKSREWKNIFLCSYLSFALAWLLWPALFLWYIWKGRDLYINSHIFNFLFPLLEQKRFFILVEQRLSFAAYDKVFAQLCSFPALPSIHNPIIPSNPPERGTQSTHETSLKNIFFKNYKFQFCRKWERNKRAKKKRVLSRVYLLLVVFFPLFLQLKTLEMWLRLYWAKTSNFSTFFFLSKSFDYSTLKRQKLTLNFLSFLFFSINFPLLKSVNWHVICFLSLELSFWKSSKGKVFELIYG